MTTPIIRPHWEIIQNFIARKLNVSKTVFTSRSRQAHDVMCRHIAIYLTKQLTPYSLCMIAGHFGGLNHTSVIFAAKRMNDRFERELEFKSQINSFEISLRKKLKAQSDPQLVDAVLIKFLRNRMKQLLLLPDHKLIQKIHSEVNY